MTTAPAVENTTPADSSSATVPVNAIVILLAGMSAALLAAGSTGLLAHSLQQSLAWLALAVAIVAAWPENTRNLAAWAILATGVILGLVFTASDIPVVQQLAVAAVLASIAQVHRGLTARVATIAAMAAVALAAFHFAMTAVPTVWLGVDAFAKMLGWLAGAMTGESLRVGPTFAGVDFLVVTITIYTGWLVCTVPPRRSRAIWGLVVILIGHLAYLITLAYSEKLLDLLPAAVVPPPTDAHRLGLTTATNTLRESIPWNLPLVALLIHGLIVVVMAAVSPWTPVVELAPDELKRQKAREEKEEVPGSVLVTGMLFQFGPVLLAVVAVLSGALVIDQPDLKAKKIVAYEKGNLNWQKPEYDTTTPGLYGLLPTFVESLGGQFLKSKELSNDDLSAADVVLLIHPTKPWPKETLDRVWAYVRRGGSLLVLAESSIHEGQQPSAFNDVLEPTSMRVRFDTAVTQTGNWEQSYEIPFHPATVGLDDLRNNFGIQAGSSIAAVWPARPALVGQWGWSDPGGDAALNGTSQYNPGERLGDLVLAAEQPLDQGRVFVLGDTSPFQNDNLPNAYPFVGRLLSYLSHRQSNPQTLWRQMCTLAALAAMLVLLAGRPAAWQIIVTSTVMAATLASCVSVASSSGRVLPDGRSGNDRSRGIAYVDASHLEAYAADSRSHSTENHGISEFLRTLMREGYLPLMAPDLAPDRLQRARLLVSIAPARAFSPIERQTVKQFVDTDGGLFLCIVGAEESPASAPLLADFGLKVPKTPVPPGDSAEEPAPLAAQAREASFGKDNSRQFSFYAPWPIKSTGSDAAPMMVNTESGYVLIQKKTSTTGAIVVIGDTHFASNENLRPKGRPLTDRVLFWRWFFSRAVPNRDPWDPPAAKKTNPQDSMEGEGEGDAE